MQLYCDHCGQLWNIEDSALISIQEIFRAFPDSRISAKLIKTLKPAIGLPMMAVKQFAGHKTLKSGHCFFCNTQLDNIPILFKNCGSCGALNLDIPKQGQRASY
jgi:hypothetical protein